MERGRVLVVDDAAINRQVIGHLLARAGLATTEAASGAEALRLVAAEGFDLVLMDIQMPGMDGCTAALEIRAMGHARLPIIAFTAHATEADAARVQASGMDGILPKPVDPAELRRLLDRLLPPAAPGMATPALDPALAAALEATGEVEVEAILAACEGDVDLLRDRLQGFVEVYGDLPDEMEALIAAGDAAGLSRMLLSLRLPLNDVGAWRLARAAHALGLNLRRPDQPLDRVEDVLARFSALLAAMSELAFG